MESSLHVYDPKVEGQLNICLGKTETEIKTTRTNESRGSGLIGPMEFQEDRMVLEIAVGTVELSVGVDRSLGSAGVVRTPKELKNRSLHPEVV
ncbi:hypothetical protein CRG98_045283 [Punica granatum]|uniref:Uncharacterized protein n=1 Tax=Punica granatum TaxID=22663 RepID=A0A2I0HRG7_PUNGR|nr:hypothetical protein CRG98_045283 [Punica granatum]